MIPDFNQPIFQPYQLGSLQLKNRFVLAPMTRSRTPDEIPNDLNAKYYEQRSSAGLIITEATSISPEAKGAPWVPGIYNEAQIQAWRKVVDKVHEKDAKIFLQLWHTGRISHPDFLNGKQPLGPSAIKAEGKVFTEKGFEAFTEPAALTIAQIEEIIKDYGKATENAIQAGFDGVELHSAFGYLPNQFLSDRSNQRTDAYGGSIENRIRFVWQVLEAMIAKAGALKVGIRIAPSNLHNSVLDSNPAMLYAALLTRLNLLPLAYVSVMEPFVQEKPQENFIDQVTLFTRKHYDGTIITNGNLTQETANAYIENGTAHLAAFGTDFLANPDLPTRFAYHIPLNKADRATFYGGKEKGYTDYPEVVVS